MWESTLGPEYYRPIFLHINVNQLEFLAILSEEERTLTLHFVSNRRVRALRTAACRPTGGEACEQKQGLENQEGV